MNRNISKKLKANVLESGAVPASRPYVWLENGSSVRTVAATTPYVDYMNFVR